jgi:hypothetical protein
MPYFYKITDLIDESLNFDKDCYDVIINTLEEIIEVCNDQYSSSVSCLIYCDFRNNIKHISNAGIKSKEVIHLFPYEYYVSEFLDSPIIVINNLNKQNFRKEIIKQIKKISHRCDINKCYIHMTCESNVENILKKGLLNENDKSINKILDRDDEEEVEGNGIWTDNYDYQEGDERKDKDGNFWTLDEDGYWYCSSYDKLYADDDGIIYKEEENDDEQQQDDEDDDKYDGDGIWIDNYVYQEGDERKDKEGYTWQLNSDGFWYCLDGYPNYYANDNGEYFESDSYGGKKNKSIKKRKNKKLIKKKSIKKRKNKKSIKKRKNKYSYKK